MSFLTYAALLPLLSLMLLALREAKLSSHTVVLLAAGLLALSPIIERLSSLVSSFRLLAEGEVSRTFLTNAVKILGVGWITHIAADVCAESGAPSLAARVELCGRLEMLLLCYPYIEELVTAVMALAD